MGTVAITAVPVTGQGVLGAKRAVTTTVTGSASYATGGDVIPLGPLGLRSLDDLIVPAGRGSAVNSGLSVRLAGTPGAPLLQFYDTQATQVANAVSLATRSLVVTFLGT